MSTSGLPLDQELLTPNELAARLKCSRRTVMRDYADGQIPARLVRGLVRFYWPDVLKALPVSQPVRHRAPTVRPGMSGNELVLRLKESARNWERRR